MEKITVNGCCKYCGQIIAMQVDKEYSDEVLDELASKRCDCDTARELREVENAITEAIEDVDKMFPEREEVRGCIKQACDLVGHELIDSITVKIDSRTKTTIKKTTKGKIRVERVVKNTESREH